MERPGKVIPIVQAGQAVDANEENRFELQPLDVLNIKHPDIVVLTHHLPFGAGHHLGVFVSQGGIQRIGDGLHLGFAFHKNGN